VLNFSAFMHLPFEFYCNLVPIFDVLFLFIKIEHFNIYARLSFGMMLWSDLLLMIGLVRQNTVLLIN